MSKILIWKQFTTHSNRLQPINRLFPLCQRYSFESNSQQFSSGFPCVIYCSHYVKDTHLKAIHNSGCWNSKLNFIVPTMSKILIWKQFTTTIIQYSQPHNCSHYVKDTHLKAIHNWNWFYNKDVRIVPTMSKILIWKQFTTVTTVVAFIHNCSHYVKDTHLKAIHNHVRLPWIHGTIVPTMSKILIWKQFTTYS